MTSDDVLLCDLNPVVGREQGGVRTARRSPRWREPAIRPEADGPLAVTPGHAPAYSRPRIRQSA